jgi:hypothetical protein
MIILLQVLLLLVLIVLGIRLGTHLLRGAVSPSREIADLQARILQLEESVAEIREEQTTPRDAHVPTDRLLPRRQRNAMDPEIVRQRKSLPPPNEDL